MIVRVFYRSLLAVILPKNDVRFRMNFTGAGLCRAISGCLVMPRRRVTAFVTFFFIGLLFTLLVYNSSLSRFPKEDNMEEHIAEMQSHLLFLESLYRSRQEDIIAMQQKLSGKNLSHFHGNTANEAPATSRPPHIIALVKNITGTRAATGLQTKNLNLFQAPFVYQLLPHLMNDPNSLKPAYHMRSNRLFSEVVIGIPTVKRDKESYLMICLSHLISGLTEADVNNTLIVIMVGETDLEYVINIARQVESTFPKQVANGLIEVLSPAASYYPNFSTLPLTLGDSAKRVKWRTKQNLDAIYLMAYAQTKGTFYLMLEDDVIAKRNYMQEIKQFTAATSITTPNWFFLNFCHIGGIGKLFRSSDLLHFITYVQLFYNNMPIDWLLESYLADRVCTIDKSSDHCGKNKLLIRPKYKTSLFQHIGLYSSLKGKIQKIKDPHFGSIPSFYPHNNPPLKSVRTDIIEHNDHTAQKAYEGHTFFWGIKPKKGNVLEFWFEKPTAIASFLFRSGSVQHATDKFYDSVVEVLPAAKNSNYTVVDTFDEFGLADGELKRSLGPLLAIRIRVNKDSSFWVVLSEIEIKTFDQLRSS